MAEEDVPDLDTIWMRGWSRQRMVCGPFRPAAAATRSSGESSPPRDARKGCSPEHRLPFCRSRGGSTVDSFGFRLTGGTSRTARNKNLL